MAPMKEGEDAAPFRPPTRKGDMTMWPFRRQEPLEPARVEYEDETYSVLASLALGKHPDIATYPIRLEYCSGYWGAVYAYVADVRVFKMIGTPDGPSTPDYLDIGNEAINDIWRVLDPAIEEVRRRQHDARVQTANKVKETLAAHLNL
jgi:hypothetical protein